MCSFTSILYHIKFQIPQYNLDNIFSDYFFFEYCSLQLCGQSIPVPLCYSFLLILFCCSSMGPCSSLQGISTGNTPAAPSLPKPCRMNPTQHMILLLMFLFLKIMPHSSRRERFDTMGFLFSNVYCCFMQGKNCASACSDQQPRFAVCVRMTWWSGFALAGWCLWAYLSNSFVN